MDRDQQKGDTNNLKTKISNPFALIWHSCLLLAAVAQSLKSTGRNSALFMLTSSPKKQHSRLSDLAHHYSLCDRIQNSFQPHSMSAMLALASILSLESNASVETSISEIAVPLIPRSATLCDYLRILTDNSNGSKLSYWHGFRDGCVGLLDSRLMWGGALAVQQLCASGIPQTLIELLGNKHSDQIGLSPVGVVWTVSSLCQCLPGGSSTFRQVLLRREHAKLVSELISDVHLKLIRCWGGPGGGKIGVRDTVNAVVNLLAFPFVAVQNVTNSSSAAAAASVNNGFLLNMGSPQLAKLLLSSEEDKTKSNASGALSNLVRNSDKLCQDIISKGAMQALLKLVADCSAVALNPSRKDAINESPIKIALFSLAKMCAHAPCKQFLRSSDLYPVIGRLRQSPEPTIAKYASVIIREVSSDA